MAQRTPFPDVPLTDSRLPRWMSNSLWGLMLLFSAAIAVYAATYFIRIPNDEHFSRYITRSVCTLPVASALSWLARGSSTGGCALAP